MNNDLKAYFNLFRKYFRYLTNTNNANYETVKANILDFHNKLNILFTKITGTEIKASWSFGILPTNAFANELLDEENSMLIKEYQYMRKYVYLYSKCLDYTSSVQINDYFYAQKADKFVLTRVGKNYLIAYKLVATTLKIPKKLNDRIDYGNNARFLSVERVIVDNHDAGIIDDVEYIDLADLKIPPCFFATKNTDFQQIYKFEKYEYGKTNITIEPLTVYDALTKNEGFELRKKKVREYSKLYWAIFTVIALVAYSVLANYVAYNSSGTLLVNVLCICVCAIWGLLNIIAYDVDFMHSGDLFNLTNYHFQFNIALIKETKHLNLKAHKFYWWCQELALIFAAIAALCFLLLTKEHWYLLWALVVIASLITFFIIAITIWFLTTKVVEKSAWIILKDLIKNESLIDNNFKLINKYNRYMR